MPSCILVELIFFSGSGSGDGVAVGDGLSVGESAGDSAGALLGLTDVGIAAGRAVDSAVKPGSVCTCVGSDIVDFHGSHCKRLHAVLINKTKMMPSGINNVFLFMFLSVDSMI
jgi:hypothetical protein